MRARICVVAALLALGLTAPASAQERGDYQLDGATATEGKTLRFVLTSEEEVREDTEVVAFVSTLSAGEEDVRTTQRSLIFPAGTRELAIPIGTVDDTEVEEPEKVVLQVAIASYCCYQITGIITDSDSSSIAWWTGTLPGGFVTTNQTYGPPMVARPESSAPAVRIPGGDFGGDMEINSPQWINGGRLRFIVRGADRPVFAQYDTATNTVGFTPNPPRMDEARYRHGISWLLDGSDYLASGGFAWYETRGGPGVFTSCCPLTGPGDEGPRSLQAAHGSSPRPTFPKQFALSAHDTNAGTARELWMVDIVGQYAYPLTPGAVGQPRDPAFSPNGRNLAYVTDDGLVINRVANHANFWARLGLQTLIARNGLLQEEGGMHRMREPTWWPGSTDDLARIAFTAEIATQNDSGGVPNGPRDIFIVTLRDLFGTPKVVSLEKFPQSTEFDDLEPTWGPAIGGALGKSLSSAGGGAYGSRSPVRIAPAGGVVRYTPAGSDQAELLASAQAVAASTVVDARKGKAKLSRTRVPVAGAVFGGGLARVEFTGKGGRGVGLGLAGGSYADCLGKRLGEVRRLDVAVTRGSIRVRGREATAIAPKGARLRVSDRCNGTRVEVSRGKVRLGKRTVKAGKALLVK